MRRSLSIHLRRCRANLGLSHSSQGLPSLNPNVVSQRRRRRQSTACLTGDICPKGLFILPAISSYHLHPPFIRNDISYSKSPFHNLESRRFFHSGNSRENAAKNETSLENWIEAKDNLIQKPKFTNQDWMNAESLIKYEGKSLPETEKGQFVDGVFALLDRMLDEAESNELNYLGGGGPPYSLSLLIEALLAWREHVTGASVGDDDDDDSLQTEDHYDSSYSQFSFSVGKALSSLWNLVTMDDSPTTALVDSTSVMNVLDRTKRLMGSTKLFSKRNDIPFNIIMTAMNDSQDIDRLMEWMHQQEDTSLHPSHVTLQVALKQRQSMGPSACQELLESYVNRAKEDSGSNILRPKHFRLAIKTWSMSRSHNFAEQAKLVYEMMPTVGVKPDVESINNYMLTLAAQKGRHNLLEEIEVLYQEVCASFEPTSTTYLAVFVALTSALSNVDPEEVRRKLQFYLFEIETFGIRSDFKLQNSIMSLSSRVDELDLMEKHFRLIEEEGRVPTMSNHRTRILGWSRGGNPEKTSQALKDAIDAYESGMIPEGPSLREFNAVLQAWNASGIDSKTKALRVEASLRQMEELARTKGYDCQPDFHTYGTVIGVFASSEEQEVRNRVFDFFQEMKENGVVPSIHVTMSLMRVHSQNGNPEKGEQIFQNEIKKYSGSNANDSPLDIGFYTGRFYMWHKHRNPDMCARSILDAISAYKSRVIDSYPNRSRIQETIQLYLDMKRPLEAEKFLQTLHEASMDEPSLFPIVNAYQHVNLLLSFYRKNKHVKGAAECSWRVFQRARSEWLAPRDDRRPDQLSLLSYVEVASTLAASSNPNAQGPLGHLLRDLERQPFAFFRKKNARAWMSRLDMDIKHSSMPQKDDMLVFFRQIEKTKMLSSPPLGRTGESTGEELEKQPTQALGDV